MTQYFEGDLAEFNELCLALKKRTDECILKAEDYGDRVADQVSLQFEDIVEGLQSTNLQESPQIHALPHPQSYFQPESEQQHPALTPPWQDYSMSNSNATSINNTSQIHLRAPGSAGSGSEKTGATSSSKEKEKKEKQNFWEATFGKDSKYQRPYAPAPSSDNTTQQLGMQASSPPGDKRGLVGFGMNRQEKQSRSFSRGFKEEGEA
ncbi:hypothetical protein EYC84_001233 [Monilinia fructicola]|uniref:Uncharacterized protein n=1 Tax=Monilinia fructicola TaxID=38448 RepID=A0A5M9JJI6_MONFR|nr:hypothetical protein EYC84_001233 [Monilinia fructicola]